MRSSRLLDHLAGAPDSLLVGTGLRVVHEPERDSGSTRSLSAFRWCRPAGLAALLAFQQARVDAPQPVADWRWMRSQGGYALMARRHHLHGAWIPGAVMLRLFAVESRPERGAGTLAEGRAALALAVDLDVAERRPGDARPYCPTVAEGLDFLGELEPSVILDAGGGLVGLWCLQPAHPDVVEANTLGGDLTATVGRLAGQRGWAFDSPPALQTWVKAPGTVDRFNGDHLVLEVSTGRVWPFADPLDRPAPSSARQLLGVCRCPRLMSSRRVPPAVNCRRRPSRCRSRVQLLAARYLCANGQRSLRHWRGGWWLWETSRWVEVEDRFVREDAYRFTEHAHYMKPSKAGPVPAPWAPNRHKIADLLDALAAVCFLPETVQQPAWIDGVEAPDGVIVACANGLLHVETRTLLSHDPGFFNQTAVPFAFDGDALDPCRWLEFLDELWPEDPEAIDALQEFMGYVISGRLDLQKILLLVGPTRGGKGAIARVLGQLVGPENVAGPTLSSLGNDFGLAPLLGKPLAVISDARLDGRASHAVVERLLAISGEDTITVNRKYRDQWTGKLPARFMLISNELPHFGDAAGAIVGRFVVLLLTRSWLGEEDPDLEPALHDELPEILGWALDGLDRLRKQGRFTVPPTSDEAVIALMNLASPVAAFVRDRCARGLGAEVTCAALYTAWKSWAEDNGHKPGTTQVFGRNLYAVVPGLHVVRPRDGNERERVYHGVNLK